MQFSAIEVNQTVFAVYYSADREMTLARVPLDGSPVIRRSLPSVFSGWDSHNSVAVASAPDGSIHVSGNMHAGPLIYFHSKNADAAFVKGPMIGTDESRVSYPLFLRSGSELFFVYRNGSSGDGNWIANKWSPNGWQRIGTIFSGIGFGGRISAYPHFVGGKNGEIHVAVIWRKSPDVASNVEVSYAKTRDLRNWATSEGNPIRAPLSPESMERVVHTGEDAGLLHARLSLDQNDQPVIAFTRYTPERRNSVAIARPGRPHWYTTTIAVSNNVHAFKGLGSIPDSIALTSVQFSSPPWISYRFPKETKRAQQLDPDSLAPVCPPAVPARDVAQLVSEPLGGQVPLSVKIGDSSTKWLTWSAQPAFRDQPRACTPETPLACNPPPSTLRLTTTRAPIN